MTVAAFDRIAPNYDELWTRSHIGRLQRNAVWRHIDPLFRPGDAVLDLGCGTGEDAVHLMQAGVRVCAIDASPEMVRLAQERGVDARTLRMEEIGGTDFARPAFDGAISNFGVLNCVADLKGTASALGGLIRPGGHLALCTLGRFCLWEVFHYRFRAKAFRRLRGHAVSSMGVRVLYPSVRQMVADFLPHFRLIRWHAIGVFVPPSYVAGLAGRTLDKFGRIDARVGDWPVLRALADHRLLIFART
jgi:SAM-dependent methyltransferase